MIIGISGKIGTGKNLVASIIQYWLWKAKVESAKDMSIHYTFKDFIDNEPLSDKLSGWKTVRFADKLKDIVCILLGCTREQLEDREFKEKELGEEWTRYCLENSYGSFMSIEIPDIEGTFGRQDYFFTDIRDSKEYWGKYLKESKNSLGIQFIRKFKLTPRLLLQKIGTDLFKYQLHPNVWVNATMDSYKKDLKEGSNYDLGDVLTDIKYLGKPHPPLEYPNWIITDTRFANEADAIKQRGGIVIRVNRPCKECGLLNTHKMSCSKNVIEHESETALDDYIFDYVIDNDSTIEDLIVKVKNILLKEGLL